MLLYLQSLSAIIYGIILIYYLFIKGNTSAINIKTRIILVLLFGVIFSLYSYDYLINRLSMTDSISLIQRFGSLIIMEPIDYVIGIRDTIKLPEFGFHNGVIYTIAISGIGGIIFIINLLFGVYLKSRTINLNFLFILLILAIFAQNGGIFSPNKIALIAFSLLPLACVNKMLVNTK